MKAKKNNDKQYFGGFAFLPMIIFLVLYIGAGFVYSAKGVDNPFGVMPISVPLLVGVGVGMFMGRASFDDKIKSFTKSAGEHGVIVMMLIYLLAGAFAGSAKAMGGVDAVVNLGLTYVPQSFILSGIFLISCFISLAMGTSMGTIAAISPIAVGLSQTSGISAAIALAAVASGAMFGDNLSIVSDTTISACEGMGCKNRDKFRMNFFIALPAAALTMIILAFQGGGAVIEGVYAFNFIKVIPYLIVLIAALFGINVFIVLITGIVAAGVVGFMTQSFTLTQYVVSIGDGIGSMSWLMVNTILICGMVGMIQSMGGIQWVLEFCEKRIKNAKGAEYTVAGMVAALDCMLGNNTLAIIISVPLAKKIAAKYDISRRRMASILDIFSCSVQGIIVHGGQLLIAAQFAGLSPVDLIPYSYYQIFLGIAGIITIQFIKTKSASELGESYDEVLDDVIAVSD